MLGPIRFHYGCHTKIGAHCFMNFNFTVQDNALVTIGNNNNFGPNLLIETEEKGSTHVRRQVIGRDEDFMNTLSCRDDGICIQHYHEIVWGNQEAFGGNQEIAFNGLWSATEPPIHLRYDRMWIYSDYAESSDPELIAAVVEAIKALEVGAATDMGVEDYTDILTFTFADGSTARLEFEEQIWVKERNERYCVEGLASLRELLDGMISDEESS